MGHHASKQAPLVLVGRSDAKLLMRLGLKASFVRARETFSKTKFHGDVVPWFSGLQHVAV
jgi:hypothetical protein